MVNTITNIEDTLPMMLSILDHAEAWLFSPLGLLLRLAVLWHKYTGTIQVSLISALLIIGLIAGLVSIPVNLSDHKACVINENSKN